jgi:plyM20|nr:MAG TPA: peptidoglycan hydrolase [Caudoviricetes sp.]
MSYSSLVEYVKISPNKTSPRDHAIDTITIHCMAGNLTIETCANVFAPSSRQASSNYGVGSDGRIGCYVDENDRSWCSSNRANDMRAITIEVANDGGADTGWHVSGVAMNSLIKLVADVCKRNNIPKLVWSDNKDDRINHRNGCNMTVHRDFKNKDCPGAYLMSKMPYIADEVNKLLGASGGSSVSGVVPSKPAPVKSLDEVAKEVINGKWGNNPERKERLEASGYVYSAVQAKVNELLGSSSKPAPAPRKSITEVAQAVMRGDYGNGEDRKNRLQSEGYNYSEVQAEVNRLYHSGSVSSAPSKSIDTIAREVINGKWGNGSSRKSRLEAAGYNYKEVQARVNALLK